MTTAYPAPTPTPISVPFWEKARTHQLAYQRCRRCRQAVFPPRAHCPHCWHAELDWQVSSGRGVLASLTVIHRPGHPSFADDAPFTVALVDLAEGFRMLSNVVGTGHDHTAPGTPLRVRWIERGDYTLPVFERDIETDGQADA